ncbi:MAG: hypothetical protein Q7T59_00450, partial [Candidatus Woesebacteria bacterium]|nr:hypothetical protein [Candidatus Woesebacteria bacterium]
RKVFVLSLILVFGALIYRFILPSKKTHSANFTAASASLSNSRFSYRAGVASGTSGASLVTIDASGNADNTTNHLFPKDIVCATNSIEGGCVGNVNYTVANIVAVGGTTFNTTTALSATLEANGFLVATQSGSIAISFTTTTEVPIGGTLLITIPAAKPGTAGRASDGIPDTAASIANNGFDFSTIAAGDVTVSDIALCTSAGWGAATVTAGNGTSTDHTISFTRATATCAASKAVTVTIDNAPGVINPAPLTTHTQGQADAYQINIKTRDGSTNTLDQSDVTIAPVEGVLISATVDETLSLTVAAVTADSGSYCGITRDANSIDSTATSVPWGTLSPTYGSTTEAHNANQQITISTNASAGYNIYIEENDQMGKDGVACTGNGGESVNCIQDTVCKTAPECTESTLQDWTADPSSYVGLGYSLQNVPGTTSAIFDWNGAGDTDIFNAKQIADIAAAETRQSIMYKATPADADSAYICYRIDITATQPAGYYYNKVKYTAIPIF